MKLDFFLYTDMNMRLWSIISWVNGLAAVAVKPFGFRLTKTQLAVRRSGPRLSNNYCVSAHCMAVSLWLAGHFHQVFVGCSPHKRMDISP